MIWASNSCLYIFDYYYRKYKIIKKWKKIQLLQKIAALKLGMTGLSRSCLVSVQLWIHFQFE